MPRDKPLGAWHAGFSAGLSGGNAVFPPEPQDRRDYADGFAAGKAARERATAEFSRDDVGKKGAK